MATDTRQPDLEFSPAAAAPHRDQAPSTLRVIQTNKFHYLKGGAERYYFDVSDALRRRGLHVDHLAMSHPRNVPAGPADAFVSEVDYHARMSPWTKVRQAARAIYNPEAARQARRIAGSGGPAVAHLHNVYHQLSPSVISAFARRRVPMVQTLHDYKLVCPGYALRTQGAVCERCLGGRYFQAVRHRCVLDSRGASLVAATEAYVHRWLGTYDKIARLLCPSHFMLEKMASFGVPREKLVHLPYFLPTAEYQPAEPVAEPICVYVGRLSAEKGIGTLIDAVARLPRGSLELRILGEGPLRAQLEAQADRCRENRVTFLGFQSGRALHDAIRGAAFAVVPSEWYENFPFAILECFALARPVVGARIGGIPELVQDGRTGRLHESGNAESLAEALAWMTSGAADLAAMGRQARLRIDHEFSEDQHIDRLLAIYDEVVAEASPGR